MGQFANWLIWWDFVIGLLWFLVVTIVVLFWFVVRFSVQIEIGTLL